LTLSSDYEINCYTTIRVGIHIILTLLKGEFIMPMGKGTYGSRVGRPPMKKKKKKKNKRK